MAKSIQYSFERYEKKYFVSPEQQSCLLSQMQSHIRADDDGEYTIGNVYYDTDDWRLIRASIEKPAYKEKLRVRGYGVPTEDSRIFIELKKKYNGLVYKRRITTEACRAEPFLYGLEPPRLYGQIGQEIAWFQQFYQTTPKVFIAYDRVAFAGTDDPALRITFDTNMRWRDTGLDLSLGNDGQPLLADNRILMEIKMPGACPIWLSRLLSETGIFPVSFSKYGTCYREHILKPKISQTKKEVVCCA